LPQVKLLPEVSGRLLKGSSLGRLSCQDFRIIWILLRLGLSVNERALLQACSSLKAE
jgi:hypothetical protein